MDNRLVLKYLKLVYNNFDYFETEFLSKLESIEELSALIKSFREKFDLTPPLNDLEIKSIKYYAIRNEAKLHFENFRDGSTEKSKFLQKLSEKVKQYYIEEEICQNKITSITIFNDLFNTAGMKAIGDTFTINRIKEYSITENKRKIHYGIQHVDKLIIRTAVEYLNCWESNLKEIILNDELLFLNANMNDIEKIQLNKKLVELEIAGNNLTSLVCNPALSVLFVNHNLLKKIKLNEKLKFLVCNVNKLKNIRLNKHLKEFYVMDNQLEKLELNSELLHLSAQGNPLKYIKLNKKVKEIEVTYSANQKIEIDNSVGNDRVKISYWID